MRSAFGESKRADLMAMGAECAKLGLTTPQEVGRYITLGVRFETRAMLLPDLIRDLQFVRSAAT